MVQHCYTRMMIGSKWLAYYCQTCRGAKDLALVVKLEKTHATRNDAKNFASLRSGNQRLVQAKRRATRRDAAPAPR